MNQRKLFFFHIPKTAGTSFRELLQAQFDQKEIAYCYANKDRIAELKSAVSSSKLFVSGHLDFSVFPLLENRFKTISFFRDPIDRCISHYLHMLRSTGPRMMELKKSVHSLPDFLESPFGANLQTRFMDGSFERARENPLEAISLETAIEHTDSLDFIGLAERMDESISRLNNQFNYNFRTAERLNVASNSELFKELKAAYRDLISEANSLDLELYEYVLKKFEAKP